jgi:hypothetical protein
MDLDIETLRLAVDRVAAVRDDLHAMAIDQLKAHSIDDLTAGRLGVDADKLDNVVELLNQTVLKGRP